MQPENIDLAWVWSKLQSGIKSNKNDYHLMQLSYVALNQFPKTSTVVLRQLSNRHVYFHTDYRSEKIKALQASSKVCLHWYSLEEKVQIVFQASAKIHHLDEVCQEKWSNMRALSKECYHQLGVPKEDYKPELATFDISSEAAFNNFSVVACEIHHMDVLLLRLKDNIRFVLSENDQAFRRVMA